MWDIRFNLLKKAALGEFLSDIKNIGKEYLVDMSCSILAGKNGNPYRIKRQLLGLTQKGYFDISEKNNKTFFKLTPKGHNLIEWLKFVTGKIKWDGQWRILIFDIPEKERYKRNYLRMKLSELGFKQLQQSVWVTPYPLPESFSNFVKNLRVRPYLYSITANHINRENELKKYFKL